MKISVRFTMAIEMLLLCKHYEKIEKLNSKTLAEKIGTSPIIARQIMADLSSAGLIESKIGPGGITLKKALSEITLLDVYKALGEDEGSLLKFPIINSLKSGEDTAVSTYSLATDSGININVDIHKKPIPNEIFYINGTLVNVMKRDFNEIQARFEDELRKRTLDTYYETTVLVFNKFIGNTQKR